MVTIETDTGRLAKESNGYYRNSYRSPGEGVEWLLNRNRHRSPGEGFEWLL
jgi:hypothetical protein